MKEEALITNILQASSLSQLIPTTYGDNIHKDTKAILKRIHPDICDNPKAHAAFVHFDELVKKFTIGSDYHDDMGKVVYTRKTVILPDRNQLRKQIAIIKTQLLEKYTGRISIHEKIVFPEEVAPLHDRQLEPVHVNWVLSRMLEFIMYMTEAGYVHMGLNPESIFVVPSNHGIQVISFYFSVPIGAKVSQISSWYKSWYPTKLFVDKIAAPYIDIELAKKTAVYLLGEKSGNISALYRNKDIKRPFIEFLQKAHTDPIKCYKEYRAMLKENFESKFHNLNI